MRSNANNYRELQHLVKLSQQGDKRAFEELYGRTAQAQYFMLVGQIGKEDASDLLQELYLVAWRNIGKIQPHCFISYLTSTGRNLCRQHLRKKAVEPKAASSSDDFFLQLESGDAVGHSSEPDLPEEKIAASERRNRLIASLKEDLSDQERQMILMRYYQGMRIKDIAVDLGVSRNTVRNVLNRALAVLRRKVGMLPFGAPFSGLLAEAVEELPVSGCTPFRHSWQVMFDRVTRAVAAVTILAAVGTVGLAANQAGARQQLPENVELRMAEALAPAPQLIDTQVSNGLVGLTVRMASASSEIWCVDEAGVVHYAEYVEQSMSDELVATWWFALPGGTYQVHLRDTLGAEAVIELSFDKLPVYPAPSHK